jgi:1-acyl-sn-glycerol-3-phosphate acyltransferase
MKKIIGFLWFKVLGWEFTGNTTMSKQHIKKTVIIAAPHTHWKDFFVGLAIRYLIGFKCKFLAKKELFKGSLGKYMEMIGGVSVDRSSKGNMVDRIVNQIKAQDEFRLAIAPEGTRAKVNTWKSGFYSIASQANVPIIMVRIDLDKKKVHISEPFYITKNLDNDLNYISKFYNTTIKF